MPLSLDSKCLKYPPDVASDHRQVPRALPPKTVCTSSLRGRQCATLIVLKLHD